MYKKRIPRKITATRKEKKVSRERNDIGTIDESKIRELFLGCSDVLIEWYTFDEHKSSSNVLLIYSEGLCDLQQINETVLPKLKELYHYTGFVHAASIEEDRNITIKPLHLTEGYETIVSEVFEGKLVLWMKNTLSLYSLDIANPPERTPEEPNTEVSILGPRDGFVESIITNTALIRKRLKTSSLQVEQFVIGRRSKTKVRLLYMKDIINMQFVEEVRQRLNKIDTDVVLSNAQLESLLVNNTFTFFPLLDYTGRPDYAVQCLSKGRLILIVDGSPMVNIAPVNFAFLFKAPEDVHFNYIYSSFARIIRFFGLFFSLFLPGFYISLVNFHQDQIPFLLLATIVNSRQGIPFSAGIEMMIILGLYELFREAGVRLPKALGQTLTVVGGLIIGDAAIRAGLTSPSMVVVASLVAVSRYTLVNQINSGTITIMSYGILLASMILGLFGFFISTFFVLLILANIKSFGLSYLAPISPIFIKDLLSSFIVLPKRFRKKRPDILQTTDNIRQGDDAQ